MLKIYRYYINGEMSNTRPPFPGNYETKITLYAEPNKILRHKISNFTTYETTIYDFDLENWEEISDKIN